MALDLPSFLRPEDHELITLFLRPRIAGELYDRRFPVHEADVNSVAPADLVAGRRAASASGSASAAWYFFCPARYKNGRRQRVVGAAGEGHCWKSEGHQADVRDPDGRRVGRMQRFSFGVKTSTRAFSRLGWCMLEFSLSQEQGGGGGGGDDDLVLCKVYRSPRAQASSCGSKRKAAGDHPAAPPTVRPKAATANGDDQPMQQMAAGWLFGEDVTPAPPEIYAPDQYQNVVAADDGFVRTVGGVCTDEEIILRLAAGETVEDMLGPATPTGDYFAPFPIIEGGIDAYCAQDCYWSPRQSSSFERFMMSMDGDACGSNRQCADDMISPSTSMASACFGGGGGGLPTVATTGQERGYVEDLLSAPEDYWTPRRSSSLFRYMKSLPPAAATSSPADPCSKANLGADRSIN